jgi:hypothetical protein
MILGSVTLQLALVWSIAKSILSYGLGIGLRVAGSGPGYPVTSNYQQKLAFKYILCIGEEKKKNNMLSVDSIWSMNLCFTE